MCLCLDSFRLQIGLRTERWFWNGRALGETRRRCQRHRVQRRRFGRYRSSGQGSRRHCCSWYLAGRGRIWLRSFCYRPNGSITFDLIVVYLFELAPFCIFFFSTEIPRTHLSNAIITKASSCPATRNPFAKIVFYQRCNIINWHNLSLFLIDENFTI